MSVPTHSQQPANPSTQQANTPEQQAHDQQTEPGTLIRHAQLDRRVLTPNDILKLQRTVGNRAVGQLLNDTGQHQHTQSAQVQRNPELRAHAKTSQEVAAPDAMALKPETISINAGDTLQRRFNIDGVIVASSEDIERNPQIKEKYMQLNPIQQDIFRELIADPEVFSFSDLLKLSQQERNFESASSEQVNGRYYDVAKAKQATYLQARDAEVALLQKIANFLNAIPLRIRSKCRPSLYIRLSKGPCTSCRDLIKLFKQDFPNVRIVIEYEQKVAMEKEQVGKDQGQAPLSYGFQDAKKVSDKSHLKIIPFEVIDNIPGVKGFSATTLKTLLDRYMQEHRGDLTKIDKFVSELRAGVMITEETQRAPLAAWMKSSLKKLQDESPTDNDFGHLSSLAGQTRGAQVTGVAKLVLY